MHLKLKQVIFYFEKIDSLDYNYLNIINYQVLSKDEKERLVNANYYLEQDFLLIPQIDRNEIVLKYLAWKRMRNLVRNKKEKNFYTKFHWYIEDNNLVEDWNIFEKEEILFFASQWCEKNQIKFTIK